jgi:hypothetical protein
MHGNSLPLFSVEELRCEIGHEEAGEADIS